MRAGNIYRITGFVTFALPFGQSHGRILLSRDSFEQIIEERGVSWLSRFYWQHMSAARHPGLASVQPAFEAPHLEESPERPAEDKSRG